MRESIEHYLRQLREMKDEAAYFALLELDDAYIPEVIQVFGDENDPEIKSMLVEIVWKHRSFDSLDFLQMALQNTHPQVWKNALDGIVTIGGDSGRKMLEDEKKRLMTDAVKYSDRLTWIEEAIKQVEATK